MRGTDAAVSERADAGLIFAGLGSRYFHNRGAREPLATATAWTSIVLALDGVVIAGLVQHSLTMFDSVAGTWLHLLLIITVVWSTEYVILMLPPPRHGAGLDARTGGRVLPLLFEGLLVTKQDPQGRIEFRIDRRAAAKDADRDERPHEEG